ncbi:MAG: NUDIX domain-containing protein [Chitinophagales bacterium]
MYKLFINNKIVFLCQNPAHVQNIMYGNFIIEPYTNRANLETTIQILLGNSNSNNLILFHKDVDALFTDFCSFFKCIEAAGGVVVNDKNEILLIFRRGSWDLPKGKIEKKESIEVAAIREVEEETGLSQVEIVQPIVFSTYSNKATYHSYEINGKPCLKISYWFEMKTKSNANLIPQTEEDIEQAIWVAKSAIPSYFDTMYSNIIDVLKAVL